MGVALEGDRMTIDQQLRQNDINIFEAALDLVKKCSTVDDAVDALERLIKKLEERL